MFEQSSTSCTASISCTAPAALPSLLAAPAASWCGGGGRGNGWVRVYPKAADLRKDQTIDVGKLGSDAGRAHLDKVGELYPFEKFVTNIVRTVTKFLDSQGQPLQGKGQPAGQPAHPVGHQLAAHQQRDRLAGDASAGAAADAGVAAAERLRAARADLYPGR